MKKFLNTVSILCSVAQAILSIALIVLILRDWGSDDEEVDE